MLRKPFVSGRATHWGHTPFVDQGTLPGITETREPVASDAFTDQAAFPVTSSARRIVHVIAAVDPNAGGPATVVSRLAAAQAARGHHVTIVSSIAPSRVDAFKTSVAAIPGLHRVHFQLADKTLTPADLLKPRTWKHLKQAIAPADVVHLHGVWDTILVAAARVAKKHSVPYVVRPCGMLDPWSLQQRSWKKKAALRLVFRRMLDGAAALHVLNQTESDLIEPLGISAPRQVIPNGIFLEEVSNSVNGDGREFLRQFPALQGKRYMLFLSRLHFKKGLDLLALAFIRVAAADKDLHLVVAGADNGAKDSFVRDIDAAGLADRVHVVGPLYGAVKLSAYRNATCFCLPSRQEGFSLAVTEALACGTPVVITQDTHFPEAAQAGAGIETNLDPAVIADAVLKITRAPLEVQEVMGMAGRRLVQQRFTWPRIAGMTLNLYASIEKKRRQAILAASWTEAKRVLVPALRAAGLAVTWFITDMTIGR